MLFLFLCICSPIDIVFRPGTHFNVKFLPVLISHGAYEHVRRQIVEGKRENIDFTVINSGCSGPTFANYAVVIFYPSRYTSSFGRYVTPEEAEKKIQETLEMFEK
ncbi:MAG: hypothetical protein LBK82_01655 [Planctomycetaceae bacterium]|jgi:hypothetical protein|nr:hypothetical protein [Planctomycetaceae bacterium]